MRKLLLAAAAVVALATPAFAVDNPLIPGELGTATAFFNNPPKSGEPFRDVGKGSCTEYATYIFQRMGFENIDIQGHAAYSTSPLIHGRAYTVVIRCETEAKVGILFFVAGNYPNEASFVLRSVDAIC